MSMNDPAAGPLPSASVLLLRDGADSGLEVLLLERPARGAFMGQHAFAGGKLEPNDVLDARLLGPESFAPQIERLLPAPWRSLPHDEALALYVCACRELFEETGVLLARHRDGTAFAPSGEWLADLRRCARAEEISFVHLLYERGLVPALERLAYWAHWVTPSGEPRRYDTRFFVARLPPGQAVTLEPNEHSSFVWLTPRGALAAASNGELRLPPPTVRHLEDMTIATTTAAAWELASVRRIAAVLPKLMQQGESKVILLPWDPDYDAAPGDGLFGDGGHPMAGGASRLVLAAGVWLSRAPAPAARSG